jgi:hypothetical protein
MNSTIDESVIDTSITLSMDSARALNVLARTLEDLGWNIVELCRDGLTGQLFRQGHHTIVVTCMPCFDARTELLIAVTTINGLNNVQNTIDAISALNDAAVMKIA